MTLPADPRYLELLRRRGRVDSLPMPRAEPDPPAAVVAEVEAMKAAVLRDRGARLVMRHHDLRPVPAEAVNEPEPEHQEAPLATATTEATNGVKLCATCGKPCNASNGRCYGCRPGGGKPGPRKPKPPAPAVAAEWDAEVAPPPPAWAPVRSLPAPAPSSAPDLAAVVALVRLMDRLGAATVRAVYLAWSGPEGGEG